MSWVVVDVWRRRAIDKFDGVAARWASGREVTGAALAGQAMAGGAGGGDGGMAGLRGRGPGDGGRAAEAWAGALGSAGA